MKRQFWIAATATYPTAHVKAMKGLEKLSRKAHAHLAKFDAKSWTKAYISTTPKTDNVDNNMSESFNSWILNER